MLGHLQLQRIQPLQHFAQIWRLGRCRGLSQLPLVLQPRGQREPGLPGGDAHGHACSHQRGGNDDEGRHLRFSGLRENCSTLPTMMRKSRAKDASPSLRSESTATKRPSRVTAW